MKLNKNLQVLLYASNLWYFGEWMLWPLFAIFTEKIGGDILDITGAWSIYLIVTWAFYIIIGKATDKRNNKEKIMICGYVLNTICTAAYIRVNSSTELFLVQAGLGIAAALATPTWYALYAKYKDKNHDSYQRWLAWGEAQIITGVAIVIGGIITTYASFTILFIIMTAIQCIATLYLLQLPWKYNNKSS